MKMTGITTLVLVFGLVGRSEAANLGVIVSPPNFLSLVVLGLAVAAIVVGFQLLGVIRGGYLSRAWQIFIAGFGVLALAQILTLVRVTEIAPIPAWVAPALTAIAAGVFFYGVFETKKVLS
ncbi:MAG: hypothetical protein AB1772_04590 [Candidatus Zixiibacteriota bacterium]